MKILFIRSSKAFLPDIDAYLNYFNQFPNIEAYDSSLLDDICLNDFDIIWEFKGLGGIKPSKNYLLVHEYLSLSTGRFAKIKDFIKRMFNTKPNIRIFLNENVKKGFGFKDRVPLAYRDMGVSPIFLLTEKSKKKYDFVYVGPVTKERSIDKLLFAFKRDIPDRSLCLIGNYDKDLYDIYKKEKNIIFKGKVPYNEVANIASKAEYAFNFIPDEYPYNLQTSTKLLEYLAMGLKVVSTNYKWVRDFEIKNDCSFYKLDFNNIKLDLSILEAHNYRNGLCVKDYIWNNVLEKSEIKNIIDIELSKRV